MILSEIKMNVEGLKIEDKKLAGEFANRIFDAGAMAIYLSSLVEVLASAGTDCMESVQKEIPAGLRIVQSNLEQLAEHLEKLEEIFSEANKLPATTTERGYKYGENLRYAS